MATALSKVKEKKNLTLVVTEVFILITYLYYGHKPLISLPVYMLLFFFFAHCNQKACILLHLSFQSAKQFQSVLEIFRV